uniref:Secreted protein n=1 Tax=Globodera rostochiensis TaxID=31243 RepID=A0A914HZX5_GLORO
MNFVRFFLLVLFISSDSLRGQMPPQNGSGTEQFFVKIGSSCYLRCRRRDSSCPNPGGPCEVMNNTNICAGVVIAIGGGQP